MNIRSTVLVAALFQTFAVARAAPQQALTAPAVAVSDACPPPPSFGAKEKSPVSIEGKIYFLEKGTRKLPDFSGMESRGSIYTPHMERTGEGVPGRIPGVTNRYEWFAIDYQGTIYIPKAGVYLFRLYSDDGSILTIDGKEIVNIDGLHPHGARERRADLTPGDHTFRLSYFQGPAYKLGLQLWVTPPDEQRKIFNLADFSKPRAGCPRAIGGFRRRQRDPRDSGSRSFVRFSASMI